MKNLSMISKPQTGYTVKKAAARRDSNFLARRRQSSLERFMQERANREVQYVNVNGIAVPQPRV